MNEQIIKRLQTDAPFALMFAVANNPQGILNALAKNGIVPNSAIQNTTDWSYNLLLKMLSYDKAKAIQIVTSVPYVMNSKATWTNGCESFFTDYQKSVNAGSNVGSKFSLEALLGGLGAGLGTYAGLASNADGTYSTQSAEQLAAEKAAADKAAADKKRNMIIGFSIGGVVLLIVLYMVFKKKKTN